MEDDLVQEVSAVDEEQRRARAREQLRRGSLDILNEPQATGDIKRQGLKPQGAQQKTTMQQFADTSGAVAADIGKGVTEAPMQVIGGGLDATREVFEMASEAENWIAEQTGYLPALNLRDPFESGLIVNKADRPDESIGSEIPKIREAESVTGAFVRGGSQFLLPFSQALKATKGLQVTSRFGQVMRYGATGAVVDFSVWDPYEARLSDLIAELPTGQARPFFEWMASEDSALEGRLKNALEGTALGMGTDAFLAMAGGVIRMRKARAAALRADDQLRQTQPEGAAEATRKAEIEEGLEGQLDDLTGAKEAPQIEQKYWPEFDGSMDSGGKRERMERARTYAVDVSDNALTKAKNGDEMAQKYVRQQVQGAIDHRSAEELAVGDYELDKVLARYSEDMAPDDLVKLAEDMRGVAQQMGDGPPATRLPAQQAPTPTSQSPAQVKPQGVTRLYHGSPAQFDEFNGPTYFHGERAVAQRYGDNIKPVDVDFGRWSRREWPTDAQFDKAAQVYGDLTTGPQNWVTMREFREQFPELSKDEFDSMVKRLYLEKKVNVAIQDDQGILTEADRAAGVMLGPERKDLIVVEKPPNATARGAGDGGRIHETIIFDPSKLRSGGTSPAQGGLPRTPEQQVDELIGPEGVLRERTAAEKAVDEIEDLPAMKARARAEEITGQKFRSKADAIEGVRKSAGAEPKPYINTRTINTEDDFKTAFRNIADEYEAEVNQGKRTTEAVIADAKDIKDFEQLSKQRPERLTDAEQYALREMWASSTRQVRNLAEQAAVSNDPVVQYAFRRAVTMHRSIQAYAFEARASAARQLRQWAIPAGDTRTMLETMENSLESFGGADVGQELAKRMQNAFNSGNRLAIEEMVKRGALAKTMDMVSEAFTSAILYQPSTQIVNAVGNALVMPWEVLNRKVAAGFGRVSPVDGVEAGEAGAMMRGMTLGFRDAMREARHAFRTGESYISQGKVELPRQSAFSPERLEMQEGTLGAHGMKMFASGVQLPFRMLNGADTFFKVMNERAELYAQAMRAAVREGGESLEDAQRLFADYVENPTRPMQEAAQKAAQDATFTTPVDGFAKQVIMKARSIGGPFGTMIFPFVQTPANILSYVLRGSPIAYPASRRFREAWAAGGAQRDRALAHMATGSAMLALGYDMVANGEITGNGPPPGHVARSAWLKKHQMNSIKIGDKWFQYSRLDPFGMWFAISANIYETFAYSEWDADMERESHEVAIATAFSLGESFLSKTWMTGVADLMDTLMNPDYKSERYVQGLLTSFVPSIFRTATRVDDPMLREIEGPLEAYKAAFFNSKELPLKRDWLGRPITRASGMGAAYDLISPFRIQPDRAEPIDNEILRLGWGPSKPDKRIVLGKGEMAFLGVPSPDGVSVGIRNRLDLYSRYIELSGQVKRGGYTLNERLNRMVQGVGPEGRRYREATDGPEGGKRQLIQNTVSIYRQAAKAELIKENKDYFAQEARRRVVKRDRQAAEQAAEQRESLFAVPE